MSAVDATNAAAVQEGVQRILMEQLARQMLETTERKDGAGAATNAYRGLFPQILADAVTNPTRPGQQ